MMLHHANVWNMNLIVKVIPVCVQDSSMESSGVGMQLLFIDCIILDEKSDALIVVSRLEAERQALHHRFPHLR